MANATGPAAGPSGATPHTWMKNHTLEGDGVLTGFYNHLWKRNKDFQSCRDVMIPDTIVYDHNFPRSWYTYDKKHKNIEKRQGKDLDPTSIFESFSKSKDPEINIVASYMFSYEDSNTGNVITSVEFFNERGLQEFVNRKIKKEGILQKFVLPKGHNNSIIQAVWSPRICVVQRRMNINPIRDKSMSDKDPYCTAVTYEGPTHYSEESSCAARTTQQIERMCLNIVHHFYNTEHKSITRMVVYFKVDPNDMVWLLWCGSVRISERHTPSQMPVNLAPIFTTPTGEADPADSKHAHTRVGANLSATLGSNSGGTSGNAEDRTLLEMDLAHSAMAHDIIFKKNYIISPREKAERMAQRALRLSKRHIGPHGAHGDGARGGTAPGYNAQENGSGGGMSRTLPGDSNERWRRSRQTRESRSEWYDVNPTARERYDSLINEREAVIAHIDDLFYTAYGHFMLHHDPEPYYFTVDTSICDMIGTNIILNLMEHLHIDAYTYTEKNEEGGETSPTTPMPRMKDGLSFCITASDTSQNHMPITKVGDEAIDWLGAYYDSLEERLKQEVCGNGNPASRESTSLADVEKAE